MHVLQISPRIDSAEVHARRVPDRGHLLEPHTLAPLLEQLDKEWLSFIHAARDVVALCLDSNWHAHRVTHAEPINGVHRRPAGASPSSQCRGVVHSMWHHGQVCKCVGGHLGSKAHRIAITNLKAKAEQSA